MNQDHQMKFGPSVFGPDILVEINCSSNINFSVLKSMVNVSLLTEAGKQVK